MGLNKAEHRGEIYSGFKVGFKVGFKSGSRGPVQGVRVLRFKGSECLKMRI